MALIRSLIAIFTVAIFGFVTVPAQSAEPVKLRVVWYVVPFAVTPVLFMKPELMTHVGKTYNIELVHLASGSSFPTALAAGEVDIGPISALPMATSIQNAHMDDLRLIADEYEDGVEGWYSGQFVVLKDSPIQKIEDLKGKVVANLGVGSSGDMAMRFMLRQHGLEAKRDYTTLEASPGNMPAMLLANKVELINTTGLTSRAQNVIDNTRVLFDRRQAFGGPTQEATVVSRAGFLEKNRAAVVDYLEDYFRAMRWFYDPKNHDEAIKTVSAFNKAPEKQFDWMFTSGDEYRDPNGMPNMQGLQKSIDVLAEFGLIKTGLDISKYTDFSLVKEATARIK